MAIGAYVRGCDYIASARALYDAVEVDGRLEVSGPSVWLHLYCHGAELLLKAALLAATDDFDPKSAGHNLKTLYEDLEGLSPAADRLKVVERGMTKALREIPVVCSTEGCDLAEGPSVSVRRAGDAAHITSGSLFDWDGVEHAQGGGTHRYFSRSSFTRVPIIYSVDGPIELYPYALRHWCELAVSSFADIVQRNSDWPIGRRERDAPNEETG